MRNALTGVLIIIAFYALAFLPSLTFAAIDYLRAAAACPR